MAKQTINTGTSNDAGNGDNLRTAFTKINENFSELYVQLGSSSSAALKDIKGSVFADDSTVLVDAVNGTLNGNLTGNVTGDVTGDLTGNVTGNITSSGTSTFSGTLDLTGSSISSDVDFGNNDLTNINNLTIGGSLLTQAMSPLLATGGNGQTLTLAGGQSTAGDGGDAILNAGAGTGTNGDVQIGASNTANIVIGDGSNTVDYPSGTTVDFTGATITGISISNSDIAQAGGTVSYTTSYSGSVGGAPAVSLYDDLRQERIIVDVVAHDHRITIPAVTTIGKIVSIECNDVAENNTVRVDAVNRSGYYEVDGVNLADVLVLLWTGGDWVNIG